MTPTVQASVRAGSAFACLRSSGWVVALVWCVACGPAPARLDWSSPVSPTAAPESSPSRLHVDGRTLKTTDDRAVRLRGVNVCSLEFDETGATWQLQPDGGSQLLDGLVDPTRWGANVVRMPVNQERFLTDDGYASRVERLIDASAQHGLYVLLDVQWERAERTEPYQLNILKEPTFGEGNTTEAFWLKASGRFSNRTNLLFDLINEPHDVPFEQVREKLQQLIDSLAIRAPETPVIAAGPDWSHSVRAYRDRPLRGANVIFSAHEYLPYDPPEKFDENFVQTAAVLPVLIGEFDVADSPIDGRPYQTVLIERAEAAGVVGWLPWAIGCGMSLDDDGSTLPAAQIAQLMRSLNAK